MRCAPIHPASFSSMPSKTLPMEPLPSAARPGSMMPAVVTRRLDGADRQAATAVDGGRGAQSFGGAGAIGGGGAPGAAGRGGGGRRLRPPRPRLEDPRTLLRRLLREPLVDQRLLIRGREHAEALEALAHPQALAGPHAAPAAHERSELLARLRREVLESPRRRLAALDRLGALL